MTRFHRHVLVVSVVCLIVAGVLRTCEDRGAAVSASAREYAAGNLVWVGVQVLAPNEEENDYWVGTVAAATFQAIESSKYNGKFLTISNLRVQDELGAEGEIVRYYDCADRYDQGVILVQYDNVLTIEVKKGDPLEIAKAL